MLFKIRRRTLPKPIGPMPGEDMPPVICRAIFEELFILANGDIVCASPDPTGRRIYGNVYRDRIRDVFNGQMYREMRNWQLKSRPGSWCPAIETQCRRRVSRASVMDKADERCVKLIELEPISSCNLKCPKCPVTSHFPDPSLAHRANQKLPLEVMDDIVNQLPGLETILFYGFGEPFLHQDAIPFLRNTKRSRPDVFIATSTNALPFTRQKLMAIAEGALVDKMVFAIDGIDQASYAKYRIGGEVRKALANMELFVAAVDAARNRGRIEIVWQYILFNWNDSADELERVKALAQRLGIRIDWVATHSTGASNGFLLGSPEYIALRDGKTRGGTAEVRLINFIANGSISDGIYLARVTVDRRRIEVRTGKKISFEVTVENRSQKPWTKDRQAWTLSRPKEVSPPEPGSFRVGVMLQTATGKRITELAGALLPDACRNPRGCGTVLIECDIALSPGNYRLLIDIVEEHVCWFSERGSPPCLCPMAVLPDA